MITREYRPLTASLGDRLRVALGASQAAKMVTEIRTRAIIRADIKRAAVKKAADIDQAWAIRLRGGQTLRKKVGK